jgi:hypothetical protein
MKIGVIGLFAVLSLPSNAFAQQSDNPDCPASITREQWKARIESAKARVQEMRRQGTSFVPAPAGNPLQRILEDSTLVFGDIVATERGMFQFIGGTAAPHDPEDFRQVVPERAFPKR